ncbi:hypothetical protein AVEN_94252-1 [Araneus ventricosus]|uniref:Uncharacterized protein n=1 Tax=Araneus ventricosus TaxID=182803 RepID=A0A4Y2IFZ2_ARAVE|nr:hypothetical protein AVEN_94252-1 [Araneus ventricosus]
MLHSLTFYPPAVPQKQHLISSLLIGYYYLMGKTNLQRPPYDGQFQSITQFDNDWRVGKGTVITQPSFRRNAHRSLLCLTRLLRDEVHIV